ELAVLDQVREDLLDREDLLEAGRSLRLGLPDLRHAARSDPADQRVPAEVRHAVFDCSATPLSAGGYASGVDPAEQAQEAVEDRQRMGRAAGDEQVDRHDRRRAAAGLGQTGERTAGDRARADSDAELRRRNRLPRLAE